MMQASGRFLEGGFDVAFPERGSLDAVVGRRVLMYQPGARLLQLGITTGAEVDVETLDQRLAEERTQAGATCIWEMVLCAWARKL